MKEHLEKFLKHLERSGASPHTIRAYRKDLELFFEGERAHQGAVALGDVRGFVASEIKRGSKKSTAARRLAALRSFLKFLHREGYLKQNPAKLVASPKQPKHLPRFLTVDEAFSLVESPEGMGFLPARDRATLELLYSSGLRVSELAALNADDLNTGGGLVKVRGKGKKERLIPVGAKALEALKSYMLERRLLKKTDKALFLNRNGTRLADRSIRRIVRKYSRTSALSGVSPHTLRHTFATHHIAMGTGLVTVQEFLGHKSLDTTKLYVGLVKKRQVLDENMVEQPPFQLQHYILTDYFQLHAKEVLGDYGNYLNHRDRGRDYRQSAEDTLGQRAIDRFLEQDRPQQR